MATKIIVLGSVNGQLRAAFDKITDLHAKNVFNFALVTGNLFSEAQDDDELTALLSGKIAVPCPTYFTVGTIALPGRVVERMRKDKEIAQNLCYLGKRSVTKTSDGVRIVALGGQLDQAIVGEKSKEQYSAYHTLDDAKALRGAHKADILLTSIWPAGVWRNSRIEAPRDVKETASSEAVAELCAALKPRYHFSPAPGNLRYEREPFFSRGTGDLGEDEVTVTRFVALASFGNSAKQAMSAFNLKLIRDMDIPIGATISPFYQPVTCKRPAEDSIDGGGGNGYFRFSNGREDDRTHKCYRGRGGGRRKRSPPPGPDRCFFCLAGNSASDHMVASIGDTSYVATAKGPLPSSTTFKDAGFDYPAHVIIAPFNHVPRLSRDFVPDEKELADLFREMTRYKDSLQGMIAAKSRRKLGAVTWEISRKNNIHIHWQVMPVPAELVRKQVLGEQSLVEAGFRVLADDMRMGKFEDGEFGMVDEIKGDYLRIWIWAEDDDDTEGGRMLGKILIMHLQEFVRFDLQYPRKVMAKLLDVEERIVWQNVAQTDDEEKADVAAFQEAFKDWDFTV